MSAVSLFIKLYRKKHAENAIIFILFSLLSTVISMVLFVQENNSLLLTNQLEILGFAVDADPLLQNAENVLGMIALFSILIGTAGGLCLIGFRNRTARKAMVMMRIWGMQRYHVMIKAVTDFVFFGILSSVFGYAGGYFLFLHFTKKILKTAQVVKLLSVFSFLVLLKVWLLNLLIIVMGNIYIDFRELDLPVTDFLYKRKTAKSAASHIAVLSIIPVCTYGYAMAIFHVNKKYVFVSGLILLGISAMLFFLFHLFFGVYIEKKRRRMKIKKSGDLSFCFLCSRNKQNAVLAIVISVGTVILCLSANILFNIGGILRNAYRDNMGYTDVIFAEEYEAKDGIREKLDQKGYTYTYGYSKLMNYSELDLDIQNEGMFWLLIIEGQTDQNRHFSVPIGSFICEEYFATACNLTVGQKYPVMGTPICFKGLIQDNQYLSLISYNIIVNQADWGCKTDESYKPIFILDISESEERELKKLLREERCSVDSASGLIVEIKNGFSDYIDVLFVVLIMLLVVTATIFYTVIREDLYKRKTELYLYRIFGASYKTAKRIIFNEYVMVALVSSFSVSLTSMMLGEMYFYFGIKKHFPLSIPIVTATTILAVCFILMCCNMAGGLYARTTGLEAIRDE